MLDGLTLDQMRIFVAVAEAGSFRAGAARVARAQSAISQAIANLEITLGVALFDRSGYRPALTAEGEALLEDARAVLLRVDSLRARARGMGEGVESALSLVVDPIFPIATIGAALAVMREIYPTVGVRVRSSSLGGPLTALRDGSATIGVIVGEEFQDARIRTEALAAVSLVAVVAAGHPLALPCPNGEPMQSVDVADHLQIVLEDPTPVTDGRDLGVLSPRTWRVSSQDTKHALILSGLGWGRLPLWAVERDIAEGRLVRLSLPALGRDGAAQLEAYLAHRADATLGPAAGTLRKALLRLTHAPSD